MKTRGSKYGPLTMGTVRDDGFIFRAYKADGSEQWHSPKAFHRFALNNAMSGARSRAKAKSIPFDIDTDYLALIFPSDSRCPALRVPLVWGSEARHNSPSLDRIVPSKGYVRGNVQWLSHLANSIKTNATTAQICAVADFLRKSTTDDAHQH